jgi:hypothetical protein
MSYIAGSLLLHTGDEVTTFMLFANIMNKYLMHTFYLFEMEKVNVIFHVYMRLMQEKLPKLAQMFGDLGLSCSIFLFEWIVTLFSNVFELDISARIWDNYFFYGDYYLMKVCIGISQILEK